MLQQVGACMRHGLELLHIQGSNTWHAKLGRYGILTLSRGVVQTGKAALKSVPTCAVCSAREEA